MAHRLPQPGDHVLVRSGEPYYAGDRGVVIASEPARFSEHRATVRFTDGGEDAVDSKFLTIVPYTADDLRRDLADDPSISPADYGRLIEEQSEADDTRALAAEAEQS